MDKTETVSAKIPANVYKEFALRVPRGERSTFIRDAICEKLEEIPRPDRLSELEVRIANLEAELPQIRKYLVRLEALTYEEGKVNPHVFGIDDIDRQIIDHLIHYKGATTPELAQETNTNRWLVLNRLRRLQKTSTEQLGKPIILYYAGVKMGKRKAWWLNQELIAS